VTAIPIPEGILLVDKPKGKTSFSLIHILRKLLNVKKIGHCGTLDPLATGVMVLLIGKNYTKRSSSFLSEDKEYVAEVTLGVSTDSYDAEGKILQTTSHQPHLQDVEKALMHFQGEFQQEPPMFSAKKVDGKRLYDLARAGKVIDRQTVTVSAETRLLEYHYPKISLRIQCSKGTYIRSIANDLGKLLGCGAHLSALKRTRSGSFHIEECLDGTMFWENPAQSTSRIYGALRK